MKKYIPVILYPYIFLIGLLFIMGVNQIPDSVIAPDVRPIFLLGTVGFIILYTLVCGLLAIIYALALLSEKHSVEEVARINRFIKCAQIPGYVLNFAIGLLCAITIFTMGFTFVVIVIDCCAIAMTGLIGAVTCYRLHKENKLSGTGAILSAVWSFVFCVDVFVSLILCGKSKK